jgi:hypothetical protein
MLYTGQATNIEIHSQSSRDWEIQIQALADLVCGEVIFSCVGGTFCWPEEALGLLQAIL